MARDGGTTDDEWPAIQLGTPDPLPPLETTVSHGHTEWVDTAEWEAPSTNHLSPFGQVEHFGAALRSGVRRPGWRRTAVRGLAWAMLLTWPSVALLAWLLNR